MSLIVVSNRLPISYKYDEQEKKLSLKKSDGGLVTALTGMKTPFKWVGSMDPLRSEEETMELTRCLAEQECFPVYLTPEQQEQYYDGYCNGILWPLFHYMLEKDMFFKEEYYAHYKAVNKLFAKKVLELYQEGDRIWVHDYHLMLLPSFLKKKVPDMPISFFLHTPLPSSDVYRVLPQRSELLKGLLSCDMIGFHTFNFARHFLSSCSRILGLETVVNGVMYKNQLRNIRVFPIGIDNKKFEAMVQTEECKNLVKKFKEQYGTKKIILGIDRIDYTKNCAGKFLSYERFLTKYNRKDTVLVQVGVPSRVNVLQYQKVIQNINQIVGRINSKFGDIDSFVPIHYINKPVTFPVLCALYSLADVCVISSIRDGMNLVSAEMIACQEQSVKSGYRENHGVVVLSEFAGAARSLAGSIIINPWDLEASADAMHNALEMATSERKSRHDLNYGIVSTNTAQQWGSDFLQEFETCSESSRQSTPRKPLLSAGSVVLKYKESVGGRRVFFLDYDGTLVRIHNLPQHAILSQHVKNLIIQLLADPLNIVYILSGRDKSQLEKLLSGLPKSLGIAAEHGLFTRHPNSSEWVSLYEGHDIDFSWMEEVKKIAAFFVRRTPGAFYEEKCNSCSFHYRNADVQYGVWQCHELKLHLEEVFRSKPLDILHGKKVLEMRPNLVSKGYCVQSILNSIKEPIKFIYCCGDDRTDENCFETLAQFEKAQTEANQELPAIFTVMIHKDRDNHTAAKYVVPRFEKHIDCLCDCVSLPHQAL